MARGELCFGTAGHVVRPRGYQVPRIALLRLGVCRGTPSQVLSPQTCAEAHSTVTTSSPHRASSLWPLPLPQAASRGPFPTRDFVSRFDVVHFGCLRVLPRQECLYYILPRIHLEVYYVDPAGQVQRCRVGFGGSLVQSHVLASCVLTCSCDVRLSVAASLNVMSMYHDTLLERVVQAEPKYKALIPPSLHTRYTRAWSEKNAFYKWAARVLEFIRFTELLIEMGLRRKVSQRNRWRGIVILEVIK